MKYTFVVALLLATSVEAGLVRNIFKDGRQIASADAQGKWTNVNCAKQCCPCTDCCSCPCGGGGGSGSGSNSGDKAMEAVEALKDKMDAEKQAKETEDKIKEAVKDMKKTL